MAVLLVTLRLTIRLGLEHQASDPERPNHGQEPKEKFPKSAPGFGWGMTETTSVFTGHSDEDYELRPESSGPALPVCEMKIVDEDGREMPLQQRGANTHVVVRARDPQKLAAAVEAVEAMLTRVKTALAAAPAGR